MVKFLKEHAIDKKIGIFIGDPILSPEDT
uniref:Uncharacterized protein n=1 Tax=Rhizophora mucronata TaxID=61149 RepID=A0A2P2PLL7_RHIMU